MFPRVHVSSPYEQSSHCAFCGKPSYLRHNAYKETCTRACEGDFHPWCWVTRR